MKVIVVLNRRGKLKSVKSCVSLGFFLYKQNMYDDGSLSGEVKVQGALALSGWMKIFFYLMLRALATLERPLDVHNPSPMRETYICSRCASTS